jgi:alkylation response protein AidB-like acyl-CoA dehydrogenase
VSTTSIEEQDELRAAVRRFLADKSPMSEVRRLMEEPAGLDPVVWAQMANQLGLQGLAIPEEFGGAGYGPVELAVVLEEMGAALVVAPYLSTVVLAGQVLTASGDAGAQSRWLPAIADGSLTATLALAGEAGSWELSDVATRAVRSGEEWAVTGTTMFVVDGHTADLILVAAVAEDGLGLFAVEGSAAGVSRSRLETIDLTRRLASVEFDAAAAIRVGGDASCFLAHALDLVVTALAAEQVGGAQRCLDMAVEYAKVRVQFGRPIGSFQAIKHKCAQMLLEVESSRSAVYYASSVVAEGGAEAAISAALVKAYCSESYTHAAKENIQIHGGIGFTWEHDAHLFLKRAKSSELLFGAPPHHRERLAGLVGISDGH